MNTLRCKDEGAPGCLVEVDDRYVLRFDDLGEEPIRFCAACGPRAMEMNAAIERAFKEQPDFAAKFEAAIANAEKGIN